MATYKFPAMNFKALTTLITLTSFILCLVACVANGFQRSQMPSAKAKETKRVFKQKCSKCHAQDGTVSNHGRLIGATNLTDPEWQQRVDDKRLVNSIKHGRGQMPAFGEKLTEDQINALVLYVRMLGK